MVSLPTVGFDVIRFSAIETVELIHRIGGAHGAKVLGYTRTANIRPKGGTYRRSAQYASHSDATAPSMEIFYEPTEASFHTAVMVQFRATEPWLIDDIRPIRSALFALGGQFRVSYVEVTWDFPVSRLDEMRHFYRPRSVPQMHEHTLYFGTRRSAWTAKAYRKELTSEEPAARFEMVVRRDALRAWGVKNLQDLSRPDWLRTLGKRLTFKQLTMAPSDADIAAHTQDMPQSDTTSIMRSLPRGAIREHARRHLVTTPIQGEMADLLRGFQARLSDQARERFSAKPEVRGPGRLEPTDLGARGNEDVFRSRPAALANPAGRLRGSP